MSEQSAGNSKVSFHIANEALDPVLELLRQNAATHINAQPVNNGTIRDAYTHDVIAREDRPTHMITDLQTGETVEAFTHEDLVNVGEMLYGDNSKIGSHLAGAILTGSIWKRQWEPLDRSTFPYTPKRTQKVSHAGVLLNSLETTPLKELKAVKLFHISRKGISVLRHACELVEISPYDSQTV